MNPLPLIRVLAALGTWTAVRMAYSTVWYIDTDPLLFVGSCGSLAAAIMTLAGLRQRAGKIVFVRQWIPLAIILGCALAVAAGVSEIINWAEPIGSLPLMWAYTVDLIAPLFLFPALYTTLCVTIHLRRPTQRTDSGLGP